MVVALGDISPANWVQDLFGITHRAIFNAKATFSSRIRSLGYFVQDIGATGRSGFLNSVKSEDVTGFWIGAHGGSGGVLMHDGTNVYAGDVSAARKFKLSLIYLNVCSAGTDPAWHGLLSPHGTFYGPLSNCGNVTGDGKLPAYPPINSLPQFKPFTPKY